MRSAVKNVIFTFSLVASIAAQAISVGKVDFEKKTVTGIEVELASSKSNNVSVCGAHVGGLWSLTRNNVAGIQVGGLAALTEECSGIQAGCVVFAKDISGVQIGSSSLGMNINGVQVGRMALSKNVYGLQIGEAAFSESVVGVQIGVLAAMYLNMVRFFDDPKGLNKINPFGVDKFTDVVGVQISGLYTNAGTLDGIQISGLGTYARKLYGLQIGCVNWAKYCQGGVQIGVFNYAGEESDNCLQIGVVNWLSANETMKIVPFVNMNF